MTKLPQFQDISLENSGAAALVFDAFRRWGYLEATLDPLGFFTPIQHTELQLEGESAAKARRMYCGTIGAEFMHMPDPGRRNWVAQRMESDAASTDRARILKRLVQAEVFEQ